MHTIGKGYTFAAAVLGIAVIGGAASSIPVDGVVLGVLSASAGLNAAIADSFGDWAEQQGYIYEDRDRNEEPRYDEPPKALPAWEVMM